MIDIERLRDVLNYLKYTKVIQTDSDFATLLGKSKSYLSEVLKGKRTLSEKFSLKVCSVFPQINSDWLLYGNVDMLKSAPTEHVAINGMAGTVTGRNNKVSYIGSNNKITQHKSSIMGGDVNDNESSEIDRLGKIITEQSVTIALLEQRVAFNDAIVASKEDIIVGNKQLISVLTDRIKELTT